MTYSCHIFLLLVVVGNSFAEAKIGDIIRESIDRLFSSRNKNCENNDYKHDASLFSKLDGYFYTLYTSIEFADNEILKFEQMDEDMIHGRTTADGKCCRSLNFTLGEDYDAYSITSEANCDPMINDDSAQEKLMVANSDDATCGVLWACDKSRKGVHAICNKRMISDKQTEWVKKQFDEMGLKPNKVGQSTDYKDGNCFKN